MEPMTAPEEAGVEKVLPLRDTLAIVCDGLLPVIETAKYCGELDMPVSAALTHAV
jgi:hypothetical protein